MTPLVIVGCGGFGREVHDLVDDLNAVGAGLDVVGYVDDQPSEANRRRIDERGSRILGATAWFETADRDIRYVIGIGAAAVCQTIDERLTRLGFAAQTLVHPAATVGSAVTLGDGAVICAGARVTTNISIGRHVHVDRNCLIGHDTTIDDYVILFPGAAVAGAVRMGPRVQLGTMCAVLPNLLVGAAATVGAGAVVTADVRPGATVVGVPARELQQKPTPETLIPFPRRRQLTR